MIDPLMLATDGLLSTSSTTTIATNGFVVTVTEEPVGPEPTPSPQPTSTSSTARFPSYGGSVRTEKKKRKRITAKLTYLGKEYTHAIETDDLKLSVKDVKIDVVLQNNVPRIVITFKDKEK